MNEEEMKNEILEIKNELIKFYLLTMYFNKSIIYISIFR